MRSSLIKESKYPSILTIKLDIFTFKTVKQIPNRGLEKLRCHPTFYQDSLEGDKMVTRLNKNTKELNPRLGSTWLSCVCPGDTGRY